MRNPLGSIVLEEGDYCVFVEGTAYKIFRRGACAMTHCGTIGVSLGLDRVRAAISRMEGRRTTTPIGRPTP